MKSETDNNKLIIGAQRPRIELCPLYVTTLGHDAVDLAKVCNIFLDDWQAYVLEKALGVNAYGGWCCTDVGLVVPRQNGKNVILEARELAGCFLLGELNIGHTAHEYRTAFTAQQNLIMKLKTSPELMEYVYGFEGDIDAKRIPGFKTGHGFESIVFDFGNERSPMERFSTVTYSTRTKDGGRGLTGEVVIFDEAFKLTEEQLGAIYAQQSSRSMEGRNQTWWTSSAGKIASKPLKRLRNEGIAGEVDDLGYFEWSADKDADLDDVETWRQANPAFNIRISQKQIAKERKVMNEEQFGRERIGIWNDEEEDLTVIDEKDWQECTTTQKITLNNKIFFALDIPPSRETTTLTAATISEDNKILIEVIAREYGTAWVAGKLSELQRKYSGSVLIIETGSAASSLMSELRRYRVRVREVSGRDYAKACGVFFDYVQTRRILHTGQDVLNVAVSNAKIRSYGDSLWKWARITPTVDISPLVACTLAFNGVHDYLMRKKQDDKKKKKLIF